MPDLVQCTYLPPTLAEHITAGATRPNVYIYFWSIGGLMVVLTSVLIMPRWLEFYRLGKKTREDLNLILTPFSHIAYRLMIFFPLFASIMKYWTFYSPIHSYSAEFLIHCYEGIILFFFAKLVIMYLGTLENSIAALQSAKATKFYAVPPFGCCLKPCVASANMTHKDFRRLYFTIIQFALLTPFLSYLHLLRTFQEHTIQVYVVTIVDLLSSMLCIYGLFALMTAAHSILEQHKIHHKFWCIKLLVMIMVLPSLIFTFLGPLYTNSVVGSNEMYHGDVMADAYASFVELILFTILALFFRKYFRTDDAIYAHKNHKFKSHKVRYSKVDIMDNVTEPTDDEKQIETQGSIELENGDINDFKLQSLQTNSETLNTQ